MFARPLRNLINRYSEQLYRDFLKNPASVHSSWRHYFQQLAKKPTGEELNRFEQDVVKIEFASSMPPFHSEANTDISAHQKVQLLVRAYQVRGHHIAKLDPLELGHADLDSNLPAELFPEYYGLNDLNQEFSLGPGILPRFLHLKSKMKLSEILEILRNIYCKSIGIEYFHISSRTQCDWLRSKFEIPRPYKFSTPKRKVILDRLMWADHFEQFVAKKYPSDKRFGLEGCESLIPGMKALIDKAVDLGVDNVVMGMPHRGRLNVLSNVVRKPNESLFNEFKGTHLQEIEGSGDVKYHLGMTYDRPTPSGKQVQISLVANPSHLEAVDPVVIGKVRALNELKQRNLQSKPSQSSSMAILLHGDAAFAGQGIVYETFGISELPSYETGGTIHIIVNNQIGFTTDPRSSRSTPYCSDVAKTVECPILHVNGDDVEAVVFCMEIAAEWRQLFHKDVVVDIVCYRKYGHNEIDQPMFTQPKMYKRISKMTPVLQKYQSTLLEYNKSKDPDDVIDQSFMDSNSQRVLNILQNSYDNSSSYIPTPKEWVSSVWKGFPSPKELQQTIASTLPTGVATNRLQKIGIDACTLPSTFQCHPQLIKIIKQRKSTITDGKGLDWSTCEMLAFGSILNENKQVRLSGQDVERGTFSQRHAVLIDQENENRLVPLNMNTKVGKLSVVNSSLSEFGILGFELGYSFVDPHGLCIWEAQFGDFCNNAQVIIDQFIASGERKWFQTSGLIMNLPHGYDGQGPEHSSCRIERFLQMVDDNCYLYPTNLQLQRQHQDCNMQIAYPSTPANYFHLLRRQLSRNFRKPLILPFSKSLLRHPLCKSDLVEMDENTEFKRVIGETETHGGWAINKNEEINRLIFCSGQVYYSLLQARKLNDVRDVAIVRIEEINPFPYDLVTEEMKKYSVANIHWTQEEPINMGMWSHVEKRLMTCVKQLKRKNHKNRFKQSSTLGQQGDVIMASARPANAAVATGMKKIHVIEEQQLISDSLYGEQRNVETMVNGVPKYK
eukprot:NODE_77_length_23338_cov_0.319463.p1 type:complete len:1007 gc:universal NODE_77_length_23338_cov_0.319463:12436-9416(-)